MQQARAFAEKTAAITGLEQALFKCGVSTPVVASGVSLSDAVIGLAVL